MSEDIEQPRGKRIFDTSVNVQTLVQTLCAGLLGACIAITGAWYQLAGDVREFKADTRSKDAAQDERMARIEREQQQQRVDAKEQVRTVQEQVTGVAGDVKEILRYLRDSSASKRPELGRWSK